MTRKEALPTVRDKSLNRNVAWQSFDEGSMAIPGNLGSSAYDSRSVDLVD